MQAVTLTALLMLAYACGVASYALIAAWILRPQPTQPEPSRNPRTAARETSGRALPGPLPCHHALPTTKEALPCTKTTRSIRS
jgi:hypothetical protein